MYKKEPTILDITKKRMKCAVSRFVITSWMAPTTLMPTSLVNLDVDHCLSTNKKRKRLD